MKLTKTIAAASLMALAGSARAAKPAETGEDHAIGPRQALVGRRAAPALLEMLDGERVALADVIGRKPIYLKFWATWCVPCRKQMPHLEAAHRKYGDRIAVFAVDLGLNDSVEAVREFRAAHGLTVPIAIDRDGSLAELFHVAVTPQHVLIDRAGVIRYVGHGATPELDAALDALLRDGGGTSARAPRAGAVADEPLSLTMLDGSRFTLAGHAGRPVALTFVSTSFDTYLAKSRPAMAEACAVHARAVESLRKSHDRIVWVTIAHPVWTSASSAGRYRERLGVSTPIGIDEGGTWFHRFRVREVPTTILLDGRGVEVARVQGRGDDLERALARLR